MQRFSLYGFFMLLLLGFSAPGEAQTIKDLQAEIQKAEAEIRNTNVLLEGAKKNQKNSEKELKLTQNKIANRKKIVASLDQQIVLIGREMEQKSNSVTSLQSELGNLKQEYTQLLRSAYRNYKTNNFMAFLLTAHDFNDAYRRLFYLKRYTQAREQKATQISSTTQVLQQDITLLTAQKNELDSTVKIRNGEVQKLAKEESQYKNLVSRYKKEQSKQSKVLQEKRNAIQRLQQKIQAIIAEEARKSKNQKRTKAQNDEFVALSGRFDQNQGRLPMPVSGGVIIDPYGKHPHPTQKGLIINNNGVNIAAEKGAAVKAIFEGEVSRIFIVKGMDNCVMVRHGSYISVYSNLETVHVKIGEKVLLGQTLGRLSTSNTGDYVLHFELWKEQPNDNPKTQNPQTWFK